MERKERSEERDRLTEHHREELNQAIQEAQAELTQLVCPNTSNTQFELFSSKNLYSNILSLFI